MGIDIGSATPVSVFKKSEASSVGVRTDNGSGYTLTIKANDETNPQDLKYTNGSTTKLLPSITENVDESDFSALVPTGDVDNKWGYYFVRRGSVSGNNYTFSPAPTTIGRIVDATTVANADYNMYDLAIAARVNNESTVGSYTNTYLVAAVANTINYSITYSDSATANMPTDVDTVSGEDTVNISNKTPVKIGYTFIGWCSVEPTVATEEYSCSGTTYAPNDPYVLNASSPTNDLHLYTMWKRNTMQNVSQWAGTLGVGGETTAVDTRDGKVYNVAKLCVNYSGDTCTETQIWMTQNLDLVLGRYGVRTLNSVTSDINTNLGTSMGYSTSGSTITWTPNSTLDTPAYITNFASGNPANSLSGWTNSNTVPYQGEGSDYYMFTSGNTNADIIYSSLADCVAAGHTAELCSHYHVGNYYNWSAAVASNNTNTTQFNTDLYVAPNSICPKGWRLPNGLTQSGPTTNISEFNKMALANGITNGTTIAHSSSSDRWVNTGWGTNGFNNFRSAFTNSHGDYVPMYFVRSGDLNGSKLYDYSGGGRLWSSTARSASWGYYLDFGSGGFDPAGHVDRLYGFGVRCVAR